MIGSAVLNPSLILPKLALGAADDWLGQHSPPPGALLLWYHASLPPDVAMLFPAPNNPHLGQLTIAAGQPHLPDVCLFLGQVGPVNHPHMTSTHEKQEITSLLCF